MGTILAVKVRYWFLGYVLGGRKKKWNWVWVWDQQGYMGGLVIFTTLRVVWCSEGHGSWCRERSVKTSGCLTPVERKQCYSTVDRFGKVKFKLRLFVTFEIYKEFKATWSQMELTLTIWNNCFLFLFCSKIRRQTWQPEAPLVLTLCSLQCNIIIWHFAHDIKLNHGLILEKKQGPEIKQSANSTVERYSGGVHLNSGI